MRAAASQRRLQLTDRRLLNGREVEVDEFRVARFKRSGHLGESRRFGRSRLRLGECCRAHCVYLN
jgi:hypothetical protein